MPELDWIRISGSSSAAQIWCEGPWKSYRPTCHQVSKILFFDQTQTAASVLAN